MNRSKPDKYSRLTMLMVSPWLFRLLLIQLLIFQLPGSGVMAQPGFFGAPPVETKKRLNERIQSKWGDAQMGFQLRIATDAKKLWGTAEVPAFRLEAKNLLDRSQKLSIKTGDLKLVINGTTYLWNAPDTELATLIKPGETRANLMHLRLDRTQWKTKDKSGSQGLVGLGEGKKKLQIQLRLNQQPDPVVLNSGIVDFEVTDSAFELPTLVGRLVDAKGQPVKSADIYLAGNAQFSVYYSNFENGWFKSKSVSHFDPFSSRFGGGVVKPVKTNEKGEFRISPGLRDKRVIVLPPIGSAQVASLPASYDDWKIQLEDTGGLHIEHKVDGESGKLNSTLSRTEQLAMPNADMRNRFTLTESFNVPITNGGNYKLENMREGVYQFNRYKYVRIGKRSYSIGRSNLMLTVDKNKMTEFRVVRTNGQKVKLGVQPIPRNTQYLTVGIFEMDELVNTQISYNNQTLWSDAVSGEKSEVNFESCLIPPGKYRLVVMAMPMGSKPNQYVYKPNFVGSKIIEIGEGGVADVGNVNLMPVANWIQSSGMALQVKMLNDKGDSAGVRTVWPLNIGYRSGFLGTPVKSNAAGLLVTTRPPGKYLYAVGLDKNRVRKFDIQIPRMTPLKLTVPETAKWISDADLKKKVSVVAKFDTKTDKLSVLVVNKSTEKLQPKFGDFQVFVQSHTNNNLAAIRFMPPEGSSFYAKAIEPGKEVEYEWPLKEMLERGLCTSGNLSPFQVQNQKKAPEQGHVWAGARFGPFQSAPFSVPAMRPPAPRKQR